MVVVDSPVSVTSLTPVAGYISSIRHDFLHVHWAIVQLNSYVYHPDMSTTATILGYLPCCLLLWIKGITPRQDYWLPPSLGNLHIMKLHCTKEAFKLITAQIFQVQCSKCVVSLAIGVAFNLGKTTKENSNSLFCLEIYLVYLNQQLEQGSHDWYQG